MAHTPGPWNARPRRGNGDEWWVEAAPKRPGGAGYVAECVGRQAENSDNAHLIAAAPDLYEALKEVAHHADDECGFMVNVRAALSKAEGAK